MKLSWPSKRLVSVILGNILVLSLLLALIEGLASYGFFFFSNLFETSKSPLLARQYYAKYDPELGWINKPSLNLPNVFGPGGSIKTNEQGFRSDHPIEPAVPLGKARIVCSGDSYTFGYGVDNDHTWCAIFAQLQPAIEAVNMGGDGYGVDQAYLRYRREARSIEHQVHFFAFITDDFYRMLNDSFLGYAKPRLEIEDDRLVVKNVPVPNGKRYVPALASFIDRMKALRTVQMIRNFRNRVGNSASEESVAGRQRAVSQQERDEKARELLRQIFADLNVTSRQRGIQLVLVYLPTIWELDGRPSAGWSPYSEWSGFLKEESSRQKIALIDLFEKLKALPRTEISALFIPEGKLPYPESGFHLNEKGNEAVARLIYERVVREPAIFCALAARWGANSRANQLGQFPIDQRCG